MFDYFVTKEMAAAIVGGCLTSLAMLLGGFQLYVFSEKKRKRIEIFTSLAAIPVWTANPIASELLSSIPMVFSERSDDKVRIAYRNYHGSLNPYRSVVWYTSVDGRVNKTEVQLFSDQSILRRDLIRELAIASGWLKRWHAADFDFASLAISLVPQGQESPSNGNGNAPLPPNSFAETSISSSNQAKTVEPQPPLPQ
jgi:hypothetical protein